MTDLYRGGFRGHPLISFLEYSKRPLLLFTSPWTLNKSHWDRLIDTYPFSQPADALSVSPLCPEFWSRKRLNKPPHWIHPQTTELRTLNSDLSRSCGRSQKKQPLFVLVGWIRPLSVPRWLQSSGPWRQRIQSCTSPAHGKGGRETKISLCSTLFLYGWFKAERWENGPEVGKTQKVWKKPGNHSNWSKEELNVRWLYDFF